jgi:ferredoxin-NADP reductase
MTPQAAIPVKIAEAAAVTASVRRFTLVHADGGRLPRFSSGSHIVVSLPLGQRLKRNAYSLIGSPETTDCYEIAVRRTAVSRGGSIYLHEAVAAGDVLSIQPPLNMFPLVATARKHLFLAGGIGITPILSHINDLTESGGAFELHYALPSLADGPFASDLMQRYPGRVKLYQSQLGQRLDPALVLADQPLGTHLYVCGPEGLMRDAVGSAEALGWPERYVHTEHFASPGVMAPFTAVLGRSGRCVPVDAESTLLEALETAGIVVPNLCRGGACGQCETRLLQGAADHRDFFLSAETKAAQAAIMLCVSRAQGDRLVLDL